MIIISKMIPARLLRKVFTHKIYFILNSVWNDSQYYFNEVTFPKNIL